MPDTPTQTAQPLEEILRNHPHLRERLLDAATPDGLTALRSAFPDISPAGWDVIAQQAAVLPPVAGNELKEDLLTQEEKKHSAHGPLHGGTAPFSATSRRVNLDEAEEQTIRNTVRDWNISHRHEPSLRATGGLFSRDAEGKLILSDEVIQKIPGIREQVNQTITKAYGPNASSYTSPKEQLREFQKSVAREAQLEIGKAKEALQAAQGAEATLSTEQEAAIRESVEKRRYDAVTRDHPSVASYYAKRRWLFRMRGPRDGKMREAIFRRRQSINSLYKTPQDDPLVQDFQRRVETRTQQAVTNQISTLKELDRQNGVTRTDSWYAAQVNRQALEQAITAQEFATLYQLNPQKFEVYAENDLQIRELRRAYEARRLTPEQLAEGRIEQRNRAEAYLHELRLRDPERDPRIVEAEQRIKNLTDTEYQRAYRSYSEQSRQAHWRLGQPPDRAVIERAIRNREYKSLLLRNPHLANKFARRDPVFRQQLRDWREQQRLLYNYQEEAYRYTKKRGIFKRLWHRIRPYKSRYIRQADGTVVDTKARRWPWKRLLLWQRIENRINPLRNRYDAFRDYLSELNWKYNPILKLRRRYYAFKERQKAKLKKYFYKTRLGKLYARYLSRRYIIGQHIERLKERFSLRRRFMRWFKKTRFGKALTKFWSRWSPKAILKRLGKYAARMMLRALKALGKAAGKLALRAIGALAGPIGVAVAMVLQKVLGKVIGGVKKALKAITSGNVGQMAAQLAQWINRITDFIPVVGQIKQGIRVAVAVIIFIVILVIYLMVIGGEAPQDNQVSVTLTKIGPASVTNPDPADKNERNPDGTLPSDIKYTLNVSYTGNPGSITVVDQLPPEVDFVSAGGPGSPTYDKTAHTVTWRIPVGSTVTASGSAVAPSGSQPDLSQTEFDKLLVGQGRNVNILGDVNSFVTAIFKNVNTARPIGDKKTYEKHVRRLYEVAQQYTINPVILLSMWGVETSFSRTGASFGCSIHDGPPSGFDAQVACAGQTLDHWMRDFNQKKAAGTFPVPWTEASNGKTCTFEDEFLYAYEAYTPVCTLDDGNAEARTNFAILFKDFLQEGNQ